MHLLTCPSEFLLASGERANTFCTVVYILSPGSVPLSDSHRQEISVPQGSILSVTLFSVKIKSTTQCLKPGVDCCLYVDDFQICYRSSTMSIIKRLLQLCLNKLQQWAIYTDYT